jgi:hypothetical protein
MDEGVDYRHGLHHDCLGSTVIIVGGSCLHLLFGVMYSSAKFVYQYCTSTSHSTHMSIIYARSSNASSKLFKLVEFSYGKRLDTCDLGIASQPIGHLGSLGRDLALCSHVRVPPNISYSRPRASSHHQHQRQYWG